MTGTLYIVATPIGNLEDITLRAIRILSEVDIILAEDTRVTKKLLDHIKARWPSANDQQLTSYHAHSGEERKLSVLNMLMQGKTIALVTDAGTPGISDPGNELIAFLVSNLPDLKVLPIPGASALTTALSVSGFRTDKFIFIGFLPKKGGTKLLDWLKNSNMAFAFYESPFRVKKSLARLTNYFPGSRVLIARELTKLHETLYRGDIGEVATKLPQQLKGEVVVVVENSSKQDVPLEGIEPPSYP